jgi:hypothetical protein
MDDELFTSVRLDNLAGLIKIVLRRFAASVSTREAFNDCSTLWTIVHDTRT